MSRRRNRSAWKWIVMIVMVLSISGCRGTEADVGADGEVEADAAWVEAARSTVGQFKQRLKAELQKGLAEGPAEAIDACRLEAPRIAEGLASEGRRVGRTSHRLRNPANAPKPWMVPLLDELRAAAPESSAYRAVRISDEWVGYAEPIYIQPLCLTCHGSDLPTPISDRIREAYPEDNATGFGVGDFRGIFWVELAAGQL